MRLSSKGNSYIFFFYRDNRRTRRKRLLRCCWAVPPIPSTGRIVSLHRKKRGFLPGVSDDVKMSVEHTHSGRERRRIFISQTRAAPFFPVRENVTVLRTVCVRPRSKQVERIKESLFFCLFRGRRKRNSPCCSNTRQLPFIPLVGAPPPPCP